MMVVAPSALERAVCMHPIGPAPITKTVSPIPTQARVWPLSAQAIGFFDPQVPDSIVYGRFHLFPAAPKFFSTGLMT